MDSQIKTIPGQKRITELDGLRGLAISGVLLCHYFVDSINPKLISPFVHNLLGLSWSGVDLFFVLSGYLLGGQLIDSKNSADFFKVFYLRRACRILPLYFLWILLFIVVTCFLGVTAYEFPYIYIFDMNIYHSISFANLISFTQNIAMPFYHDWGNSWFGVTWSLAVEQQFYLALPLIIYFTSIRSLPCVLIFLIIQAPLLRTFLIYHMPMPNGPLWGFFSMPCRADSLLLGVLCAFAMRQAKFKGWVARQIWVVYVLAVALLAFIYRMVFHGETVCGEYMTFYGYTLLASFYSLVLIIVVNEKRGFLTFIVRNGWLCRLGIISYGVYMFHSPILCLVHAWFFHDQPQITQWSNGMATLFALFLTILLALISWTIFEKPIIKLGHKLKYK